MQYLHQSHYGHIGGLHTAKPIMAMDEPPMPAVHILKNCRLLTCI